MPKKALRKVFTLSSTFPNPVDAGLGVFVRSRAMAMSNAADVVVAAPIPWFSHIGISRAARFAPQERRDGSLVVIHPRWFNIPGGGLLNTVLLALCVLRTTLQIGRAHV